jgi:hypothetical protein
MGTAVPEWNSVQIGFVIRPYAAVAACPLPDVDGGRTAADAA